MRNLLPVTLLALSVFLSGCGGEEEDEPFVETVKVQVNQSKVVDSGRLTIAVTKAADSRCPLTTQCVAAGTAIIDVTMTEQGKTPVSGQMGLPAGATTNLQVYTFGPYTVQFTALTPYPTVPASTAVQEATLVVRRE